MANYALGTFRARATEWQLGESANGKDELKVLFLISSGPDTGRAIMRYFYFTGGAAEWTFKDMRKMGWQGVDLSELDTLGRLEVDLVIGEEMYNGEMQTRIKYINRPGERGGGLTNERPMDEGKKRAFADRMRAIAAGVPEIPADAAPASDPKW